MMKEPVFEVDGTIDEVEKNFEGFDFFDALMESLTEALAFEKGQAAADTFTRKRSLPSVDVCAVRTSLSMTQKAFAAMLGVSCRTVEAWESGKTTPSPTAKKLMYLISNDHTLIERLSV